MTCTGSRIHYQNVTHPLCNCNIIYILAMSHIGICQHFEITAFSTSRNYWVTQGYTKLPKNIGATSKFCASEGWWVTCGKFSLWGCPQILGATLQNLVARVLCVTHVTLSALDCDFFYCDGLSNFCIHVFRWYSCWLFNHCKTDNTWKYIFILGTHWRHIWLRHCVASRKVAGSFRPHSGPGVGSAPQQK